MDISLWSALIAIFAFTTLLSFGFLSLGRGWISHPLAILEGSFVSRLIQQLELLGRRFQGKRLPFLEGPGNELNWRSSNLALQCIRAGYRSYSAVLTMIGAKIFMVVVGALVGVVIGAQLQAGFATLSLAVILLGATGFWVPDWILRFLVSRRQAMFMAHFPDALDLIRICLEAGLGLDAAINRVGEEFQKSCRPLQDELHILSLELRAGASRTQCLRNFAERTGLADVKALVTLLIQADKFGTGIADAVRVYSEELRLDRKLKAEEAAAKVSVKLLFPLIFCIFPALLLVLLGPAAISLYENVVGISAGR
jgi:tight adherence protein C